MSEVIADALLTIEFSIQNLLQGAKCNLDWKTDTHKVFFSFTFTSIGMCIFNAQ